MTDANVRIGQWTAWGGAGQDGFYIKGQGLKGLFSGVGVRDKSVERPQGHGDFDIPPTRSARFLTIGGPCIAESAERLDWYNRVLTGLLSGGESGRVVFDMPGGPLWGDARLQGTPEFEPTLWGQRADWQLSLKFADPRLFGDARTFAAGEPAYHYGNFPAIPVFTISGDMPGGYAIDGPNGKQFRVTKPLVPGQPHVIDMATGWLTVGGVVQTGVVARGDVWAIPGGAQVTNYVTPITTGSATTSILVRSTYI